MPLVVHLCLPASLFLLDAAIVLNSRLATEGQELCRIWHGPGSSSDLALQTDMVSLTKSRFTAPIISVLEVTHFQGKKSSFPNKFLLNGLVNAVCG